jgi:hypothetical protein
MRPPAAILALSALACSGAALPPPSAPSAHQAPYRYGHVAAAFRCRPDWGARPERVLLVLSSVFGYCPAGPYDPRRLSAGRISEIARDDCDGESSLVFDSLVESPSREEAEGAREDAYARASAEGRVVLDLNFVSALPTESCAVSDLR